MNPESRFSELLSRFLDGELAAAERRELADLCGDHPSFGDRLRSELEFAELLRHAAADAPGQGDSFCAALEERFSGEAPADFATLTGRLIEGEARSSEIDELVRRCWRDEARAHQLRRELKWADILEQAAAERRSEEAFVESLATRMWAEQDQDEFVEKTQSKIVSLFPDSAQPEAPTTKFSRATLVGGLATAAAAMIAAALLITMRSAEGGVAEIVHTTEDVRWKVDPKDHDLPKGIYSLESGVVTLAFPNGAEMTIEGPAEFALRGENEAFVHSGIAMLDQGNSESDSGSTESQEGFTLQSRGLNLVDTRDTVGIDARNTYSTEAVAFNGGAEVCLPANAGSCRNLYEYEAVRVDLKRDKILDIPFNPRVFARSWEALAGVEGNTGAVRIEMPGQRPEPVDSEEEKVQVFVENERFVAAREIEVDKIDPGKFASASDAEGKPLEEKRELRSYLLQLWPEDAGDDAELEASVTFANEVVGVIYSSERLERSDKIVGAKVASLSEAHTSSRGLDGTDSAGDAILLSSDRRTVNLKLQSGTEEDRLDHVRVLVALR